MQGQIDIEGNQVQDVAKNNKELYNNDNNRKGDDLDGRGQNNNIRQKIKENNKGENTRRKGKIEKNNGSTQKELSEGLRNYEKERSKRLGKEVKATLVEDKNYSDNEKIISKGFKEATGIDVNIFKTNQSSSEWAFYSANGIFLKHNPLANKQSTNFKTYHELGHWFKDNMSKQWQNLYNIMENTITKKQIEDYIDVLNDKSQLDTKTEAEIKDFVINEIISDYTGNWANNIVNWFPFIENNLISEEYADFLAEITLKSKNYKYEVFGTIEQETQMNNAITEIMTDIINNTEQVSEQVDDDIPLFSDRNDIETQQEIDIILDMKAEKYYNKNTNIYKSKEQYRDFTNDIWISLTNKGITLSKKEFGRVSHEIETNHALQQNILYGKYVRNHFYGYEKLDEGQFKFYARIRIDDNNTPFIKSIERRYLDEQRTRFTDRIIQELEDRFGNDNNDNVISERTSKDTSINTISNKKEKTGREIESNNDNERSNENSNQLKDSKQGSFIIPKNVKDIKNLNQFINKAAEQETDKYWKGQLEEAKAANYIDWTRKESRLHWKRRIVQQYLDYKNGIEYSDRKDIQTDTNGNELTAKQQEYFRNSKAVDENGNLKVVYHGTGEGTFNIFNGGTRGANYYTDNIWSAKSYQVGTSTANKVYEGYVNIENPLIVDVENRNWSEIWRDSIIDKDVLKAIDDDFKNKYETYSTTDIVIAAKATNKFDGVIFNNIYDNSNNNKKEISSVYVTFNSNQFKNIDNKNPTNNPDIRYSDRYDVDKDSNYGFYSQLEKVIEEKMPNTTNAQQLKGILDKAGIKQDEMKWIGLDDYLKAHSLEKLSKEKVMEYIKANQIHIETVQKGDSKVKQLIDPIKEDINNKKDEIREILNQYRIRHDGFDMTPIDQNGNFLGTIGDYMPESLEKLVELDNSKIFEKEDKDGKTYYSTLYNSNGGTTLNQFTKQKLKKDMQTLSDLYDELHEAQINLSMIEDEYGDDADEIGIPKYKQYAMEGGTNYQEKLYTLNDETNIQLAGVDKYNSPHWNEKNVLAHTRTQDFEDINGNKVLFIDEIQSDLHQEGRKKGYVSKEDMLEHEKNNQRRYKLGNELRELNEKYNNGLDEYLDESEPYQKWYKAQDDFGSVKAELSSKMGEINNIPQYTAYDFINDLVRGLPSSKYENTSIENIVDEEFVSLKTALAIKGYKYTSLSKGNLKQLIKAQEKVNDTRENVYNERQRLVNEYRTLDEVKEIEKRQQEISDEMKNIEVKLNGISDIFPFKKNWHEFALRRIINDAVSQGYDEVAWTTGRQQRERYNLSKAIDYIEYQRFYDHPNDVDKGKVGEVEISAYKDGNNVFDRQIRAEDLADYIGKDLAMRILNAKEGKGTISNLDEEIRENGNSGMYLFYDQEIPSYLNKYLKKWNSKVENITLKDADGKDESIQPGFKITEEMRKSIKQNGQPLFSDRTDIDNESLTPKREYTKEEKEYLEKQRKERLEVAKMIKERSFLNNVLQSNVDKEFKKVLRNNKENFSYEPLSNEETMKEANKVYDSFKDFTAAKDSFLQKDLTSATDTAVGELLIRKALGNGNYQEANNLTATLAEKLTTAGQTVQAAAMFKRMTPEGMLMFAQKRINKINEELAKKYIVDKILKKKEVKQLELTDEKIEFINEMMKQMQEWENKKQDVKDWASAEIIKRQQDIILAKIMAKIGEGMPVSTLDKVAAWRNIAMLLNPKTIKRNLIGNIMFTGLEDIVDTLGVPIDKAVSLVTGEESLSLPNLKTQYKGLKKGLDYAIYDTKEGITTSLGGNKFEITPDRVFKNEFLNQLHKASYFGVEGLDRPFMQSNYDSALEQIMKKEGLEYGKDFPTNEMEQEALETAMYRTFKNKNKFSDFLIGTKRVLNQGRSLGLGDVIGLTYPNIPGNLTSKTFDYSVIGFYKAIKKYQAIKAKKIGGESVKVAQRDFVRTVSRSMIGNGILAISIGAALAGIITASGDDDNDKLKELTGQENYAINVSALLRWIKGESTNIQDGDFYITYSNYEPLSSMIASAAEIGTSIKKDGKIDLGKAAESWINSIMELSTLNNFSQLFRYNLGGTLMNNIYQFPSSFLPNMTKQIAQLFEVHSKSNYSDSRFVKNLLNPILQKIPGLSSTLESNYDTFGNEKESFNKSRGLARFYNVFLNTSFTSTVDMDDTKQELYDLYLSTGSTDHLPLYVKNYFMYKGQKITLTAKEKAKYQETLGKRTAEEFKKIMATSEYKNMTDEEKVKKLKNIISDINTDVKGEVVLEPRGLAYDSSFTPTGSSLSKSGYKLNLTEEMQKEYEQIAANYYSKYEKQGLYNEEKLKEIKSKAKDYAKSQMFIIYKDQLVKNK